MSASDSLSLRVTVVEEDDPSAQLLVISGGIGGPQASVVVWGDWGGPYPQWDYGRPVACPGNVLWKGDGVPLVGTGSFDFFIPFITASTFTPRCGWAIALRWDSGRKSSLLAKGHLHVSGPDQDMEPLMALFTDSDQWIATNSGEGIFA